MTYITVEISDETRSALDEATRAEGVSADEIVDRALKRHLFLRRFRQLRAETLEHMRESGQGDLADEDVFHLTEESTVKDIEYHLYVLERIQSGLERADREGVIEQDEAEARLAKWIIE